MCCRAEKDFVISFNCYGIKLNRYLCHHCSNTRGKCAIFYFVCLVSHMERVYGAYKNPHFWLNSYSFIRKVSISLRIGQGTWFLSAASTLSRTTKHALWYCSVWTTTWFLPWVCRFEIDRNFTIQNQINYDSSLFYENLGVRI